MFGPGLTHPVPLPMEPQRGRVPSPAGWAVPSDVRAGWDWLPPEGAAPRLDRVPWWVRAWYRTPLVDRYAHEWMWQNGGWDVLPPDA